MSREAISIKSSDKRPVSAARTGIPNPVDVHVGSRMRARRLILGLSQEKLGELIGLSFQQVQKYEHGTNRLSASRLFDLSAVLGVSIQYFFDDMPEDVSEASPRLAVGIDDLPAVDAASASDVMSKAETFELVRSYYNIRNPSVRRGILELCRAASHEEE